MVHQHFLHLLHKCRNTTVNTEIQKYNSKHRNTEYRNTECYPLAFFAFCYTRRSGNITVITTPARQMEWVTQSRDDDENVGKMLGLRLIRKKDMRAVVLEVSWLQLLINDILFFQLNSSVSCTCYLFSLIEPKKYLWKRINKYEVWTNQRPWQLNLL